MWDVVLKYILNGENDNASWENKPFKNNRWVKLMYQWTMIKKPFLRQWKDECVFFLFYIFKRFLTYLSLIYLLFPCYAVYKTNVSLPVCSQPEDAGGHNRRALSPSDPECVWTEKTPPQGRCAPHLVWWASSVLSPQSTGSKGSAYREETNNLKIKYCSRTKNSMMRRILMLLWKLAQQGRS